MQNPVQNPEPVMPPPPVQETNNPAQGSNSSPRNTLLLVGSILIFVAIVGVTLYLVVQNQKDQAEVITEDNLESEQNLVTAIPTLTQEQQKELYGEVVCRRFTSVEEALQVPDIACVLDLSEQNLTEVPEGVYKLEKLNDIDLSNNNLTSIPQKLIDMPNMVSINLSTNNISNVADVKNKTAPVITDPEATPVPFTGLQSLDLSGNPISEADQQKLKELFGVSNPSDPDSSVVKF
ncbi:MAG: leucine-rich repeat domain-containing protein [Candidatus Daviesbacteria bacterium]|nr:leucine-rich repeat domain-containing protein [Candidatus Daviesbacteria bacterium]